MEDNILIVLDVETTGLDYQRERIIEFAAVKLVNGEITEEYETLINPEQEIRQSSINIHGITADMVADAPTETEAMPAILEFIGDYPIVGHNVIFDYNFLRKAARRLDGRMIKNRRIDSQLYFREVFPEEPSHGLVALMNRFNVEFDTHHRAMADTKGLALAFPKLEQLYDEKNAWQIAQMDNIEYLFERYLRMHNSIRVMQSELADLKSLFKVYFEKGGKSVTALSGETLHYSSKTSYNYDLSLIKDKLDELGALEKVARINNGLLDRMINGLSLDEETKVHLSAGRIKMDEVKAVNIQKADKY